ncbi:MAG: helix-turn-helix transcriptional regulator, partial [Clostridia bacterium]|nr:helix-turn-helix transcriptional regulator [Clostridia bacterium]
GYGFLEYIRHRRMMLARYLLVSTTLPVSDIAQRVGYSDLKHFSELFKREFDLKPAVFRKQAP